MSKVAALIQFSQGKQPAQTMIKRLVLDGLSVAENGTNFDSDRQELFMMSITEEGRHYLQTALSDMIRRISEANPQDQQRIDKLTAARRSIEAALK
ncbi:MAG: hypothetical protein LAP86_10450 [Acidobacteriia bacterium]|nr:hypothetical protein [Terriglobia bacterium]